MKFSFFTDIHLTDNTPCHRTDDYPKVLCDKLLEACNVSVKEGCDFMAFGGDFCDRHRIYDYDIVNSAISSLTNSGLQTYACMGEHDLYGHNPDTFSKSALAFITKYCKSLHILWEPVHFDNGVSLYGKHEWQKMSDFENLVVDPSRYNVLICHELLHSRKMPFEIVYTGDLKLPFDLVCSGDLHCGFEPHKVGNTWYCNPGSLARKATSDSKRMPKILLIEVKKGFDPIIVERELEGFKKGHEVFSVGISETVRKFESQIDMKEFVQGFDEFVQERTNIYELFEAFKKTHEVKPDIIEYIQNIKMRLAK